MLYRDISGKKTNSDAMACMNYFMAVIKCIGMASLDTSSMV
jgi:hypothetical protein